jgi:hypothetical protein
VPKLKRYRVLSAVFLTAYFLSGCAKPDHVSTIKSPVDGFFYTVETFNGSGPSSDTTRVFAHLERNGKSKKMLVLEGENLTVAKITWSAPDDATLCLDGGITGTFRSEVTLISGNSSETIHNHLQESCKAAPASPTGS